MKAARVVIVGGGLAGLAAAESLSRFAPELSITVLEAKRRVGGRAGSYHDPESDQEIDYCQHVAMGCCTNLIDMLGHCGLEDCLVSYDELTFLHPDHPPSRFAPHRSLPAPLHLLPTISAQRYLSSRQKRQIKRGLWKLMRTPASELAGVRAGDWLTSIGQSQETITAFWDVILVSALGEHSRRVSMAAARKVLMDGFAASRGASEILVPLRPLSELFGKLLTHVLETRSVAIRCGSPVQRIAGDRKVHSRQAVHPADYVICAVPWHQIDRLFDRDDSQWVGHLPDLEAFASIPASPITGIHLWFDRPITSLDHAVMVGTTAQWLFRNPTGESHSMEPSQCYYQVVISASSDTSQWSKSELVDQILGELRHAFPDARKATLRRYRIVTDPMSVFSISPEVDCMRPSVQTGVPWLMLAGDWVQTGWPATMEGAVISGRLAAQAVLDQVWSRHSDAAHHPPQTRVGERKPGWLSRLLIRQ